MSLCLSEGGGEGADCLISLTVVAWMPISGGGQADLDNGCCCERAPGGGWGCTLVLGG